MKLLILVKFCGQLVHYNKVVKINMSTIGSRVALIERLNYLTDRLEILQIHCTEKGRLTHHARDATIKY